MEPTRLGEYGIEEYKTLRAEILRTFDASERNMLACITANGVALAYGAKEGNFFVLLFACLVPVYFWIQHISYRRAAAKLSAYISVFLEGPDTGLRWETRVHRADVEGNRRSLFYIARSVLLPYPVLIAVSLLTMTAAIRPISSNLPLTVGGLAVTVMILVYVARAVDQSFVQLRKSWLSIYKQLKAEELSTLTEREQHGKPGLGAPNPTAPADRKAALSGR